MPNPLPNPDPPIEFGIYNLNLRVSCDAYRQGVTRQGVMLGGLITSVVDRVGCLGGLLSRCNAHGLRG